MAQGVKARRCHGEQRFPAEEGVALLVSAAGARLLRWLRLGGRVDHAKAKGPTTAKAEVGLGKPTKV